MGDWLLIGTDFLGPAHSPEMAKIVAFVVAAFFFTTGVCSEKTFTESCEGPSAITESGPVCGLKRQYDLYKPDTGTWDTISYASFRGIPYATPPVGELRFKELLPAQPWEGYLNASIEGPICYQYDYLTSLLTDPNGMEEDCLTVNVHVPIDTAQHSYNENYKGLPIMVFIFPGAFQLGSGDDDIIGPEYMVSQGVIVITFNYRLGALGFLSLDRPEVPGNSGLRDMVTLLNWVQRNGAIFGGDVSDVTIAGQSAGAASAHLLTLSPSTEGLFNRAVMISSSGVRSFFSSSLASHKQMLQTFLTLLNITSTDDDEIYRQLIATSAEDIIAAQKVLMEVDGLTSFGPIIESEFEGVTRIIDDDPEVLMEQGRGKHIPLLISHTVAECELFKARYDEVKIGERYVQDPNLAIPISVRFSKDASELPDIIQKIKDRYFSNENSTLDNYVRFCSDALFIYPTLYTAQRRAEIGGAPVYLYHYSYEGQYRILENPQVPFTGAAHGEDLLTFMKADSPAVPFDQKTVDVSGDGAMQRFMQSWLNNFIRTGSPVSADNSDSWPAVKSDKFLYLDINQPAYNVQGLSQAQQELIQFYNDIYE